MKKITRRSFLKASGVSAVAASIAFAGCGEAASSASTSSSVADSSSTVDEVATENNGVFTQLYAAEVTTFNYLYTGNTGDLEMSANAVDCLVEYDTYGVMVPSLAESWSANEDNTVWTFKIRQGVKWLDYQGNEVGDVTANDWVTAAQYVNTAANSASAQYMYSGIVLNASEYDKYTAYLVESEDGTRTENDEGEAITVVDAIEFSEVGVKAIDDYTLEYTMTAPTPYFPSVLSYASYMPVYAPFLEEKGEDFGIDNTAILYNGAYLISEFEPQNKRVLTKNPTYWDAENVHIETIEMLYNSSANTIGPEQFVRGEVDYTSLDASLLNAWLSDVDGKRDMVSPDRPSPAYSYFYAFNFEPRFDSSLEPENWILAVNNENFRLALAHALDRVNVMSIHDPQNPEALLTNTVTPETFATDGGLDFTQYPAVKPYTDSESFDETKALEYKDLAVAELTEAGATFPIQVYVRYSPSTSNWDKECQVLEQQMEGLLGTDFIDIVVEAGPSTNFLSEVRRSGDYGFMKCNWGADYADPQTWTDPFGKNNSYNFMYQDSENSLLEEPKDSKLPQTVEVVDAYYALVDTAKAITTDIPARYTAFAEAEAHLIEHGIIVPLHISTDGYRATMLNIFESQYAPYGLAPLRYKGMMLRDVAMSLEEFNTLYEEWKVDSADAIAAAAQ